ncbi:hypothetical protein GCM10028820_15380 [Tessaracoccus terricola]
MRPVFPRDRWSDWPGWSPGRWQVFGLEGGHLFQVWTYRATLPSHVASARCRLSFPLTAAGQSRIHTGFPVVSPPRPQHVVADEVNQH